VSFADLDTIVKIIGPVLDAFYPAAIVIAMYYCMCRRIDDPTNINAGKWAVISAFLISILQLAVRYSEMFDLGWNALGKAYYSLPLAEYSLAWLPVCVIVFAMVKLIYIRKKSGDRLKTNSNT
jgi:LIVCS family branched-chain amino acid:cation transporter